MRRTSGRFFLKKHIFVIIGRVQGLIIGQVAEHIVQIRIKTLDTLKLDDDQR